MGVIKVILSLICNLGLFLVVIFRSYDTAMEKIIIGIVVAAACSFLNYFISKL